MNRPPKPTEGQLKEAHMELRSCGCATCVCLARAEWENKIMREALEASAIIRGTVATDSERRARAALEEIDR